MKQTFLGLLFLVSVFAAGCASHELQPLDDDLEIRSLNNSNKRPLKFSLAVAPPTISFDANSINQIPVGARRWAHSKLPESLQKHVVDVLRKYPIFERVEPLQGKPGSISESLEKAWERGHQLLLTLEYEKYETFYHGVNNWYVPNVIQYIFNSPVAAWFVADEDYGVEATVKATIWVTDAENVLHTETLQIRTIQPLDDFDRGWQLLGTFRVPGSLNIDNWIAIRDVLAPAASQGIQKKLILDLHKGFRPKYESGRLENLFRKSIALTVGVSKFQDIRIPDLAGASADAKAMKALLTNTKVAGIPQKNVHNLSDSAATRSAILEQIKTYLVKNTDPGDTCLFYFSGYGTVSNDGKTAYLVPFDTELSRLDETAIRIRDLADAFNEVKARDIFIVLDASFGGERGGRTLIQGSDQAKLASNLLSPLYGKGRTLMLASQLDQSAGFLGPAKHGAFTHYLLEAAHRRGIDMDRVPATLGGAFNYAREMVPRMMMLWGMAQTPLISGEPDGELRFTPRKGYRGAL